MLSTTMRRMPLWLFPATIAIVLVGLTAWGKDEPTDGKKAASKPKAPAKSEAPAKEEVKPTPKPTAPAAAKPAAPANEKPAAAKPVAEKPATAAAQPTTPAPVAAAAPVKPAPAAIALAKQIRAAKADFVAGDPARQTLAHKTLTKTLNQLHARLNADGQNGAEWKAFLLWEQLQAELKKKSNVDTALLAQVNRRFSAGYAGLEDSVYRNAADAIEEYTVATEVAQIQNQKQAYEQTLEELAQTVETIGAAGPDAAQSLTLGKLITKLERAGQAEKIVAVVADRYSQPNLLVDVSQEFVDESFAGPIDQTEPVVDCILGTSIRGTGHTVGTLRLDFLESSEHATIQAIMNGVNDSKTVGHNRSALIYSTGRTTLEGRQMLYLNRAGLTAGPGCADASVSTRINCIGSTKGGIMGKIVTKVASKKAPQQKAQGEAIAAQHARQRLSRKLRSQLDELIVQSDGELIDRIRRPLQRFDAEPELVQFSTTDDTLRLRVSQVGSGRLAASSVAPPIAGNAGLGIRLHRSLIENGAQQIVAGRKFDRDRIDDLLRNQIGLKLKDRNEIDEVPFSITFADHNPISVVFDGDKLSVTVRSKGFTSDDKVIEAMDVTVHYTMTTSADGLKLTRDGDFEIYPPGFRRGVDKLSFQQTSLRTVLKRNFEKAFPTEFVGKGFDLEDGRGTLYIANAKAADGWLSLGMKKRDAPVSAE